MSLARVPVQLQIDWVSLWFKTGWLDIVFLIAFAIGVFLGLKRGLGNVLPHLIEVLVAQAVTIEYSEALAQATTDRFQIPTLILQIVFFAGLAVCAIFLVRILFRILAVVAGVDIKAPINNVAGAVLSGIQFLLFLSLISNFVTLIPLPFIQHTFTDRSLSGPFLLELTEYVHDFLIRFLPAAWQVK